MFLTAGVHTLLLQAITSVVEGGRPKLGIEDYVRVDVSCHPDCDGVAEANVFRWSSLRSWQDVSLSPLSNAVWVNVTRWGYVGLRLTVRVYHDSHQSYSFVLHVLLDAEERLVLASTSEAAFRETHETLKASRERAQPLAPNTPWSVVADWLEEHDEGPLAERLKAEITRQQGAGITAAFG